MRERPEQFRPQGRQPGCEGHAPLREAFSANNAQYHSPEPASALHMTFGVTLLMDTRTHGHICIDRGTRTSRTSHFDHKRPNLMSDSLVQDHVVYDSLMRADVAAIMQSLGRGLPGTLQVMISRRKGFCAADG